MQSTTSQRTSEAGVTLVEVVFGMAIAAVLISLGFRTAMRMQSVQTTNEFRARLQTQGQRALHAIVADLSRALYRTTAGAELPYVFDNGVAVTLRRNPQRRSVSRTSG